MSKGLAQTIHSAHHIARRIIKQNPAFKRLRIVAARWQATNHCNLHFGIDPQQRAGIQTAKENAGIGDRNHIDMIIVGKGRPTPRVRVKALPDPILTIFTDVQTPYERSSIEIKNEQ